MLRARKNKWLRKAVFLERLLLPKRRLKSSKNHGFSKIFGKVLAWKQCFEIITKNAPFVPG